MPAIVADQTFPTLQDFKKALRDWAIEWNWTPHILDSDSHRVRAGCRSSPGCPFRIRANYNAKRGNALVTTCEDEHTCMPFQITSEQRPHQHIKRAETGKLKFLLEAVPKLMSVTLDTNILEIIDAVEKKYGQKIPTRQAQKVKAGLTDRVKGPCRQCHQLGHTRRHCPQLRTSATGFPNFSNSSDRILPGFHENDESSIYADGGLELDQDQLFADPDRQAVPNPPAYTVQQRNEMPENSALAPQLLRMTPQERSVPEQPTVTQDATPLGPPRSEQAQQGITTAQETRLEAAKLMNQAAKLMHEAARLTSEAARLNDSVANV